MRLIGIVFVFVVGMAMATVSARQDMGIFNILNESFAESPKDLPAVFTPAPDMRIQKSKGNIEGWIDIVGFRETLRRGGIDYIPGNSEDYAIILYDSWASDKIRQCTSCSIVYIKNKISIISEGNLTTASNNIELKWAEIYTNCDQNSCWSNTIYTIEHTVFRIQAKSPRKYNSDISNFTVFVTEYNNTISPKVAINVPRNSMATKTTIRYGDSIAVHYYGAGIVQWNPKNVPYLEFTDMDYWKVSGMFSRLGDFVLVNRSTLDYSKLNVSVSTPYNTVYTTLCAANVGTICRIATPDNTTYLQNYNITRIDYSPEKTWSPAFFMIVGMVGILGWGIKKFLRTII